MRYRVDGRNANVPFYEEAAALAYKALVDSVGARRAEELSAAPQVHAVHLRRSVAQQVAHHIDHLTGVTDGTRARYRKLHAARIAGPFGDVPMHELTRDHVSAWVNAQTGGPKTVRNAHALLSAGLGAAVRDGLLSANVAKGVKLPRAAADTEEHVYLTHEEFDLLVGWMPAHWQLLPTFLVGTGVRFGEATALTVGHLDLAHNSAHVRQGWESGGPAKLGSTKTRRSRRTVALPPQLSEQVAEHVAGKRSTDWVFTNTQGRVVRNGVFHSSVWQRLMDPFQAETGKRPRVHDLRHTFASWAIQAGIPLPIIQRQLGHESISITVDTYGHLARSDYDAMAYEIGAKLPKVDRIGSGPIQGEPVT